MTLVIPNLDRIAKDNPRLAEALLKVQTYTNQNVTPATGNRASPPTAVANPTRPPG